MFFPINNRSHLFISTKNLKYYARSSAWVVAELVKLRECLRSTFPRHNNSGQTVGCSSHIPSARWREFLGFAFSTLHRQPTNPHTHTHTPDNGQREEVQGLFLSNFHWSYTSSVQELVDKQKIKVSSWLTYQETSITKWLKIYRRFYLGYLYQFTVTFIGFTTFQYLENPSFSLQKWIK